MADVSQPFVQKSSRVADRGRGTPWLASAQLNAEFAWADLSGPTALQARHRLLEQAVRRDIVPRLNRGQRAEHPAAADELAACVQTFAGLVLAPDLAVAMAYLERMRGRGMADETLYLELLAPTARHFGDRWEDDTLDFTQVTIALGNLHRLLRDLSPSPARSVFAREGSRGSAGRRGLLVAAPGEQHTFGLAIVTEFFRQAGWIIWSGAPKSPAELNTIVRSKWFDVAGFSVAYEGRLDALRTGIRNVRQISRNPCIRIIVGGPVFIEHPEFVAQVGADSMAIDAQQAVTQAESLMMRLPA